jgi:hypothetical protein
MNTATYKTVLEQIDELFLKSEEGYSLYAKQGVKLNHIKRLEQQDTLSKDDIDWIDQNIQQSIENLDPIDALILVTNSMREKSHGACVASKIYMGTNIKQWLKKAYGSANSIKVIGIPVIISPDLPENCIVVIGKAKFQFVEPDGLIKVILLNLEKNG